MQLELNDAIANGDFNMDGYPSCEGICGEFRAVAEYMKSRHMRKVDREVYHVSQGSYDMHGGDTLALQFGKLNLAIKRFVDKMKRQSIWEDVIILMGSDFGRSIVPNTNDGTDHAWGGNYFMLGGGLNGGKILGEYPLQLSDQSDLWVKNGRMIPSTPWESVWNGIAQWLGVRGDEDLGFILPNRDNFDKCKMYTDQDLFLNGEVPHSSCFFVDSDGDGVPDDLDQCPETPYNAVGIDKVGCSNPTPEPSTNPTGPTATPSASPTKSPYVLYEAEDQTLGGTTKDSNENYGYTGTGYADFGGSGSWVEWTNVDGGVEGGLCTLDFRYANGGSDPRPCSLEVNGIHSGTMNFDLTPSWTDWENDVIQVPCLPGNNSIRVTASTGKGGPNIDSLAVSFPITLTDPPTNAPTIAAPTTNAPTITAPTTNAPTITAPTTNAPTITAGLYEAEDANRYVGISIKLNNIGNTGDGYLDMGGQGSWFEWTNVISESGPCTLTVRYTLGGKIAPRPCEVTINGQSSGILQFESTGGWSNWDTEVLYTTCPQGTNTVIRVTASSGNGGPNVDNMLISSIASSPPTSSPTANPIAQEPTTTQKPTLSPTIVTSSSPSLSPTTKEPTPSPSIAASSSPSLSPTTKEPTPNPTTQNPTIQEPNTLTPTSPPPPTEMPTATPPTQGPPSPVSLVAIISVIKGGVVTVFGQPGCTDAVDGTTNKRSLDRDEYASRDLAGLM